VIQLLATWRHEPCDGGIAYRAPGGMLARIRPRAAPCRPRALLAAIAGHDVDLAPLVELVTREGEVALLAVGRGNDRECAVAMVGDAPQLCIDAIGPPRVTRELVARLVVEVGAGLGGLRRRWYRYVAPPGWIGIRRDARTVWLHDRYPRVAAHVVVFDARPFVATDAEYLDRALFVRMHDGFVAQHPGVAEDVRTDLGLEGRTRCSHGTFAGACVTRMAVALADDRFLYLAQYEGPEEHAAAFLDVVRTIQPSRAA
jgi:hypothetical protein